MYNEATALLVQGDYGPALELVPEVTALKDVDQSPGQHPEGNAFVHTILVLSYLPPKPDPVLAWAALFHDVGKVSTATVQEGVIRFPNHTVVGAEMVREIGPRIGMPPEETSRVAWLVKHHMELTSIGQWTDKTFRRFVLKQDARLLLDLIRADIMASHGKLESHGFCLRRIRELNLVWPP